MIPAYGSVVATIQGPWASPVILYFTEQYVWALALTGVLWWLPCPWPKASKGESRYVHVQIKGLIFINQLSRWKLWISSWQERIWNGCDESIPFSYLDHSMHNFVFPSHLFPFHLFLTVLAILFFKIQLFLCSFFHFSSCCTLFLDWHFLKRNGSFLRLINHSKFYPLSHEALNLPDVMMCLLDKVLNNSS